MRRLLVITYHFPPDGSIGGQRWAGLSKYLSRLGWEIHVVTAAPAARPDVAPGVERHVRNRRRTLDDVYKSAAKRVTRRNAQSGIQSGKSRPVEPEPERQASSFSPVTAVRRIVSSSMIFPDHARGWVFRAAGAARKLLKQKKFEVVISSGPPHSAHLAALLATRGLRTPFWVDMRDPWSMTHAMHVEADWLVRAERYAMRRLERLVFPRAKRVLVNTREFASVLRSDEPETDVVHFPNGIDLEQLPTRDLNKVERGSIAHVGTLYANRNLSSLLAAMGGILRDRQSSAVPLRLRVVGALESPHRERMHSEIENAGLKSFVDICGSLPRSEALEVLSRSHMALVLAQDQPLCVPAKLYEAVGLGIPTLVIAEEGSASACEARRIGAMTLEDGDVAGLRSILEDLLAGKIATRIESKTPISYEALAGQMHRLLLDGMTK